MKTLTLVSILALLSLASLLIAPAFATQNSDTETANGYSVTAYVEATVHGTQLYPSNWRTDVSCTPDTDYCTTTGYNLTVSVTWDNYVGSKRFCYITCYGFTVSVSTSTDSFSIQPSAANSTHITQVDNYATSGYWHSGAYTAVAPQADASLPFT